MSIENISNPGNKPSTVNAQYHPQIPLGYVPNIPPPIYVSEPSQVTAINQIAGNSIFIIDKKDSQSNPAQGQGQKRPLPPLSGTPAASQFKKPRIGDAGNRARMDQGHVPNIPAPIVTAAPQTSGYYSNQKGSNQSQAVTAIPRMQRIQASKYITLEDHHRKDVRKLSEKVGGSITVFLKHYLDPSRYTHIFGPSECSLQQKILKKEAYVINKVSKQEIFRVSEEDLNEEESKEVTQIIEKAVKKIYYNLPAPAKGPASSENPAAPPSNKQQTGADNQHAIIATMRSEIPPPMPVSINQAKTVAAAEINNGPSDSTTETNQGKGNSDLAPVSDFDFNSFYFKNFEFDEPYNWT